MGSVRLAAAAVALFLGSGLLAVAGCGGGGGERGQLPTRAVEGGTARFSLATDTDHTDPALAYYQVSWQFEYATCAKLLNYPDKPAAEGAKLVPEAASGMPSISNDGKTYAFTIAKGFRFSPPSNQPVTAQTFKFVLERDLNPKLSSPAAQFVRDIV